MCYLIVMLLLNVCFMGQNVGHPTMTCKTLEVVEMKMLLLPVVVTLLDKVRIKYISGSLGICDTESKSEEKRRAFRKIKDSVILNS